MTLTDIGGCRAIMRSMHGLRRLVHEYESRPLAHQFKNGKDYVESPKSDGYRGIHRIYYFAQTTEASRPYAEARLQVELQFRTRLQHVWATAVEVAGIFRREALKANQGDPDWKRFFALVATQFAREEKCPLVPDAPKNKTALRAELRNLIRMHNMLNMFETYKTTIQHVSHRKDAKYYLVHLDPVQQKVTLTGFKAKESAEANRSYTGQETQTLFPDDPNFHTSDQVVLVGVNDIRELPKAYPNYYMDSTEFVARVKEIIS